MERIFLEDILKHPAFSLFSNLKNLNFTALRKSLEKEFLLKKLALKRKEPKLKFLASDSSSRTLKFANPFEVILHTVATVSLTSPHPIFTYIKVYALRPGKDLEDSKLSLIFESIEKSAGEYPIKLILQEKLVFLELLSLFKNFDFMEDKNTYSLSDGSYEVNLKKTLLFLIRKRKVEMIKEDILIDTEKYHKRLIFDDVSKEEISNFENNLNNFLSKVIFIPKKLTSFYILKSLTPKLDENIKNIIYDNQNPLLDDMSLLSILLEDNEYLVLKIPYKEIENYFYMDVIKNKCKDLDLEKDLYRIYLKTKYKVFVFETTNKKLLSNLDIILANLLPFLEKDGEVYPIKLADRYSREISKKLIKRISSYLKSIIWGLNYREHDTDY